MQEKPPDVRMINGRKMKCKDIPDEAFLGAVLLTPGYDGTFGPGNWRPRWEVKNTLEEVMGHIPERLFLAKARKLIDVKKKLGGCPCGCRGDYHMPCDHKSCCG